jgi:hypothetical protein
VRYFVDASVPEWYSRETTEPLRAQIQINRRVELKMAPDEARRARGAVKELMIGRITPPFLGITEDSVEQAKTTYPIQSHIFIRTFHMEITRVWFFNANTGQIYRKLGPSDHDAQ